MREIKKITKNTKEECLQFELDIANKRIAELEEKLHMVLEENSYMCSVVYHMPDPHALLEKIDFFKKEMRKWYEQLNVSGDNTKEQVRRSIQKILIKERVL